jgi:hypothetical protein
MTAGATERELIGRLTEGVGIPEGEVEVAGTALLPSAYPVSELATAAVATAGLALADLLEALGLPGGPVRVDRGLADRWFAFAVLPDGWTGPAVWDPIAGDYRARDGWIRLHTNAPHHRAAALAVLGVAGDRDEVARAVAAWEATALETAAVEAGGVAGALRSPLEWARHPQGAAVAGEPLADVVETDPAPAEAPRWRPTAARPLAGLRVLDLTRVLAGPVATRLLAGLGADVLRVDPPEWSEPGVELEVTLGKRLARLDLRTDAGLTTLRELLADADVLVHGYRADALERLGLGDEERRRIRPGLVDVRHDAYGWTGPWAGRRGFDSIVQMSSGIAWPGPDPDARSTPLPVQALDQATGYLDAAAVLRGLARRVRERMGSASRLSLARTAAELQAAADLPRAPLAPIGEPPAAPLETGWGSARLVTPPLSVGEAALRWERGPRPLGSDEPRW